MVCMDSLRRPLSSRAQASGLQQQLLLLPPPSVPLLTWNRWSTSLTALDLSLPTPGNLRVMMSMPPGRSRGRRSDTVCSRCKECECVVGAQREREC